MKRSMLWFLLTLAAIALVVAALHSRDHQRAGPIHLRITADQPCRCDVQLALAPTPSWQLETIWVEPETHDSGPVGSPGPIWGAVASVLRSPPPPTTTKHGIGWRLNYQFLDSQGKVLAETSWENLSKCADFRLAIGGVLSAMPESARLKVRETMIKGLIPKKPPYLELCRLLSVSPGDRPWPKPTPGFLCLGRRFLCGHATLTVFAWSEGPDVGRPNSSRQWTMECNVDNPKEARVVWSEALKVESRRGQILAPQYFTMEKDEEPTPLDVSGLKLYAGEPCIVPAGASLLYLTWTFPARDAPQFLLFGGKKFRIDECDM